MTNPNDAIGTNAAYGTRTSVNAFNDIAQIFSGRGLVSGFVVVPKSGMTVSVGGQAGTRDVAVAEDNLGNRDMVDNRLGSAVDITIAAASVSANRYSAIVAYINNPAQADDTTPDAPSVCGIIEVQGNSAGVSEAQIRSAITADGGTGSVAYYVVIATIYVGAGTTIITSANISQSWLSFAPADGSISTAKIADGAVTTAKVADGAITADKLASTLDAGTIVFEYTQATNAGSEETVAQEVTLDWAAYSRFVIDIDYYSDNTTINWVNLTAYNGSSYAGGHVSGVIQNNSSSLSGEWRDISNGELAAINRASTAGPVVIHLDLIKIVADSDTGTYFRAETAARTFGSEIRGTYDQITKINVPLLAAKKGGRIRVVAYK